MEDEIKKILSYMQQYVEEGNEPDYNGEYPQPWEITIEEVQYILDYITNLQEENDNLKDFNNKLQATKDRLDKYDKENTMLIEDYKSRIEKANELLQNILVVRDWEHKGKFRPVKNTSKQDVCKTIVMLNELFETPYRTNYGLLQGVGKDE